MSYNRDTFNEARMKIFNRRLSAEKMAKYRHDEVCAKLPRVDEIERELTSLGCNTAKAMLLGENAASSLEKMKERSLSLQQELTALLENNGFSADYLEINYSCPKCGDTGYYECDNRTLMCDCLKKAIIDTSCEQLSAISPLKLSTFDSFDLNMYSDKPDENGKNAYVRMSKIYDYCLDYAKNFTTHSRNILMRGATGLGKTHLSLAIANELLKQGYSVVYVSAPDILSKLEKEHFSYDYNAESETLSSLTECDLLIIDDLGTEFSTQFTGAAIYNIFNTRILKSKPQIINTNMTVQELEKDYSQRFVSRLMGSCDKLDFIGSDIRPRL